MTCCVCGAMVNPNPTNMCVACLRKEVDISEGISKREELHFCGKCGRYLNPPKSWVHADLGSRELLELCLRKIKGLDKVRYVDADFIWTEPHSKRIKVKVDVQKEVHTGVSIQQTITVELVVHNHICEDCQRVEAKDYWKARVQIRQRCEHKKTLFYLEQLILKHRAHVETRTTNIKQVHEGLDFYYQHGRDAVKMVSFLKAVVPCSGFDYAKELISTDIHNNTANYRESYSVEIVPLCRDNIVCLPLALSQKLGGISQLCIVHRTTQVIQLIDPSTKRISELRGEVFAANPFKALCASKEFVEYIVMDSEIIGADDAVKMKKSKKAPSAARHQGVESNKHALADVWVVKSNELGISDQQYHCRTHLGHLLKPGDSVLGFDLKNANTNDPNLERMNPDRVPDVILVKKVHGDSKVRARKRNWKLQHLNKEQQVETGSQEKDYNDFLEDLEEDEDTRKNINIYKDNRVGHAEYEPSVDDDGDMPFIQLSEMLDECSISRDATGEDGAPMME